MKGGIWRDFKLSGLLFWGTSPEHLQPYEPRTREPRFEAAVYCFCVGSGVLGFRV